MSGQPASPPKNPGPDPDTGKPSFALPPGATDSHCHIFGRPDKYKYSNPSYLPPEVFVEDYLRMLSVIGVERGAGAPGFQSLLRLLRGGPAWCKLSAPYRTSKDPRCNRDMAPFAQED